MKTYAQLDENKICVGITQTEGLIKSLDIVEIEDYDISILGRKYNDGVWETLAPAPMPEPETTPINLISKQLEVLVEKYESDQGNTQEMILTLASAIAEVYERLDADASK